MYEWLRRWRPPWPDLALALGLAAAGLLLARFGHGSGDDVAGRLLRVEVPRYGPPQRPPAVLIETPPDRLTAATVALTLLVTLPLAGRRRWPLAVLASQFGAVLVIRTAAGGWAAFVAILIGAYSLALYGRRPAVSLGTLAVGAALIAATSDASTPDLPGWLFPFAVLAPIGLFGVAMRAARGRADALAQRATLLERQQAAATRAAVAEERSRIARELHDVVSHHVSVMTIQAGAAGKVLDARPELAHQALAAIGASGREAMTELRHLLGVLAPLPAPAVPESPADAPGAGAAAGAGEAGGGGDTPPLRPQPGLEQLPQLVATVRAAGQPVTTRA
ncbi:MAG TPA: histidine kinase dimerization/phosphoacceptor domain-containing protein, partial [Mycobacteriales bacterium]|nr:histidine kinase dimerization/phosphoacceptor domain-containing protein [Mycobacteriales bacterium]